jgi:hypothetical protein
MRRVVETAHPHVDGGQHRPAAPVGGIGGQARLDLADGLEEVLVGALHGLPLGRALGRHVGRAVDPVGDEGDEGDGGEREGGGGPALAQGRLGHAGAHGHAGPVGPDQPPRRLGAGGLSLGGGDQAAGLVARDLAQLILVEPGLGGEAPGFRRGGRIGPARHRPEQGEHRRAGHERQYEPKCRHHAPDAAPLACRRGLPPARCGHRATRCHAHALGRTAQP